MALYLDGKKIVEGLPNAKGVAYDNDFSNIPADNVQDAIDKMYYSLLPIVDVSGSIANFTTSLALPLVALKTNIVAQGGGGTPTTPIPIVGWDSVNVTCADEDMQTVDTFTLNLGQTCYGGYVDWENGKLVIDKVCVTLDSSKNWVKNNQILTSNAYISSPNNQFPDYKRENGKCSHFEVASNSAASSGIFFGGSINILTPLDMNLDTTDKFKEWIDDNTVQVLYSLATPIEYDLTTTMPSTIEGEQNWFADSGDIELEYKMGVQEYIDKKIAEVQALVL